MRLSSSVSITGDIFLILDLQESLKLAFQLFLYVFDIFFTSRENIKHRIVVRGQCVTARV